MVVLITGSSHTGKTLLAQALLNKYQYPYLSIDLLKMGLIRSGNTNLTPADDQDLEAYLWPIVREIIKTAIENRQNLIVEGCYIPSDWKGDFSNEYLNEIRYFCLVMCKNYIKQHFSDIKNSCRATIFCASARSAGRRILIKRPRAGDGADGQFFIDCAPQSIKNTQM